MSRNETSGLYKGQFLHLIRSALVGESWWKWSTLRPWRFFGKEKTRAAQNSCNFCYLISWRKDDQKPVLLKVFTSYIRSSQIFLDPIQKRAPARSVQLEAVYLKALLYILCCNLPFWLFSNRPQRTGFKVHIFWEGHKILRNFHLTFVLCPASQKYGENFAKFCGLLRIYEL